MEDTDGYRLTLIYPDSRWKDLEVGGRHCWLLDVADSSWQQLESPEGIYMNDTDSCWMWLIAPGSSWKVLKVYI